MTRKKQVGFSLLETMVALAVSSLWGHRYDGNGAIDQEQAHRQRTDMHTSVRSARITSARNRQREVSLALPPTPLRWNRSNIPQPESGYPCLYQLVRPAPLFGEVLTIDVGAARTIKVAALCRGSLQRRMPLAMNGSKAVIASDARCVALGDFETSGGNGEAFYESAGLAAALGDTDMGLGG